MVISPTMSMQCTKLTATSLSMSHDCNDDCNNYKFISHQIGQCQCRIFAPSFEMNEDGSILGSQSSVEQLYSHYAQTFPVSQLAQGFFFGRRPLPFGGSHLRLPSGPAGIRTTTSSLSALARPTPYQLSHRVASQLAQEKRQKHTRQPCNRSQISPPHVVRGPNSAHGPSQTHCKDLLNLRTNWKLWSKKTHHPCESSRPSRRW